MAHTGENVLKGLPLKAIALAIALSNPVSAQTLEQAVSITLASNPELKSAFNQFKSVNMMQRHRQALTYRKSILMQVSVMRQLIQLMVIEIRI